MNIWILNHYATPPDTPGSTRHFDFATEFVRQGHQVQDEKRGEARGEAEI